MIREELVNAALHAVYCQAGTLIRAASPEYQIEMAGDVSAIIREILALRNDDNIGQAVDSVPNSNSVLTT